MQEDKKIFHASQSLWQDLKQQYAITEREDVQQKISKKLAEWSLNVERTLRIENPFYDDIKALEQAQNDYKNGNHTVDSIENDLTDYTIFKQKLQESTDNFWRQKLAKVKNQNEKIERIYKRLNISRIPNAITDDLQGAKHKRKAISKTRANNQARIKNIHQISQRIKDEQRGLRGSLLKTWEQELAQAVAEWQSRKIRELQQKIFAQLATWLDMLDELLGFLNQLSFEPGLLFDLSEGDLTKQDIAQLKKWLAYISKDEGVQNLCHMLGRMRKTLHIQKEEIVKTTRAIKIQVPDTSSKEEITGVILGNDLENVIPEELALLSDEDSSLLFDLKFVERRLLCFESQGMTEVDKEITESKKMSFTEEEKMGPFIICVDTSGSMSGQPESIAKAITLYMATRAKQQNRNCYLINFSTSIETLDFSNGVGIKKLLKFLQMSFHGGTDVDPALKEALNMLKCENYEKADVLTISDFLMNDLPKSTVNAIQSAKQQKNKFFSLCIGDYFYSKKVNGVFDKSWIYNTQKSNLSEVPKFLDQIG